MNIFFLRHTSLNVQPDVFYGQTDLDVSNTFEKEVKIIKIYENKSNTIDSIVPLGM